jgi:OOP family OmpA-OmpF porin
MNSRFVVLPGLGNIVPFYYLNRCIMKKTLFLVLVLGLISRADAQILKRIADRTKQKAEDKVTEKVSNAATKPIDDVGTGKDKDKKKKEENNNENSNSSSGNNNNNTEISTETTSGAAIDKKSPALATYSKFDFVPGE